MGYQIGTIDRITPGPTSMRVDFSVVGTRKLPADVKATIRSTSLLADRALELVGNYHGGETLVPGHCVPLGRSVTPKSLSEVIESANTLVLGINPQNSTNIGDTIAQLDQAAHHSGEGINEILTTSSSLLDSPDQSISDLKSIVANVADLSAMLVAIRDPMKQILNDAVTTGPYITNAAAGIGDLLEPLPQLTAAISDLEIHAGDEIQLTLDAVSDVLRINTPHTQGWISALGGILKPLPWWINTAANHVNNKGFSISYRPPLYRIRTPDGAVICNIMNFSNPGSCANVAGQPYSVDISLLQYVFMEASR